MKTVLRDSDILEMEGGSVERIVSTAQKNLDRFVNWNSLLKVMGLPFEKRTEMLKALEGKKIHIWLSVDGGQHVVFMSHGKLPDTEFNGYQWQ